jgi:hypothetical protein
MHSHPDIAHPVIRKLNISSCVFKWHEKPNKAQSRPLPPPPISSLFIIHIHSDIQQSPRLSDIPFNPTCGVGTLHFINSHSEGLNSIETALAYVEQQREATATDVLLLRRWRDLAAKKRKEAQKQIPINNFLKK